MIVEPIQFVDEPDMKYETKGGVKDNAKVRVPRGMWFHVLRKGRL